MRKRPIWRSGRICDMPNNEAAANFQKHNTDEAVAFEVLGAPGYVLNGEPFWGQDRIELLEDALASHRAPYSAVASATQAS